MHNVLGWLEASAGRVGGKTAFGDEEREVTFGQVLDVAQRAGTALAGRYGSGLQPIAVLVDRDVRCICAFMGIVASGNFYVPIDATQPAGRIEAILSQMRPRALVVFGEDSTLGSDAAVLDGVDLGDVEVVAYEELVSAQADGALLGAIAERALDTDPLYAICTSGSTGVPKGVLISHRSVIDFIPEFCAAFGLGEGDVFGNQAPFDFDVSVKDIYSTLYLGATMHVIPRKCFSMPKLLAPLLDERGVTTIVWAVSALSIVAGFKAFKYCVPSSLRNVLFSGEVMPVKHLRYWQGCLPNAQFVNLYGPTEITCNCMYYIVDREYADDEKLPLGKAFPNERIVVLDENDRLVEPAPSVAAAGEDAERADGKAEMAPCEAADGVIGAASREGELCVMGTCLALGYYRNPERTAAAFVQNPLNDRYPELMYRTGDIVRYDDAGHLVYAGRKDFQIKHMGHRIELEELEVHANAVDGIDRACCLFDERRNKIVCCYVGSIASDQIVAALGRSLPKYMIPNVYHQLDAMPYTKNGKVDRKALRALYVG